MHAQPLKSYIPVKMTMLFNGSPRQVTTWFSQSFSLEFMILLTQHAIKIIIIPKNPCIRVILVIQLDSKPKNMKNMVKKKFWKIFLSFFRKNLGSWILDPGFRILDSGSIQDPVCGIQNPRFFRKKLGKIFQKFFWSYISRFSAWNVAKTQE